jgi:hypothetical protein
MACWLSIVEIFFEIILFQKLYSVAAQYNILSIGQLSL